MWAIVFARGYMPNSEQLNILNQGVSVWNEWRETRVFDEVENYDEDNDFGYPDTVDQNIIDLSDTDLQGRDLSGANLSETDLSGTNLSGASLIRTDLSQCFLKGANLCEADLSGADLNGANLSDVNLCKANLAWTNLSEANLKGTNFLDVECLATVFGNNDLSESTGLETIKHYRQSFVDIHTLYRSQGKIPLAFLTGCGVPDDFILLIPSLTQQSINYNSCFISYSHHDELFVKRLYSRLRDEKLQVWFAPEDIQGGKKIHEQIFQAIEYHDRLLLVLSDFSIHSEWVMSEIRRARKQELQENRRKLFPIRLTSFETLRTWECFDADSGKDLAIELREYFIPDFSEWKSYGLFEIEFERLIRDLKAGEVNK